MVHDMAALTVVLTFIGGVFTFVVMRPLNESIRSLSGAIADLRRDLAAVRDAHHAVTVELVRVDQCAKAAHRRLDELVGSGRRRGGGDQG